MFFFFSKGEKIFLYPFPLGILIALYLCLSNGILNDDSWLLLENAAGTIFLTQQKALHLPESLRLVWSQGWQHQYVWKLVRNADSLASQQTY